MTRFLNSHQSLNQFIFNASSQGKSFGGNFKARNFALITEFKM